MNGNVMAAVEPAPASILNRPLLAVLTTVRGDGRLQSNPVWFQRDGGDVLVSTMREFAKARNLRARPVATLLVVDPEDTTQWVELRGDVMLDDADAQNVLDDIGERYTGRRPYFGGIVSAELAALEHPVTCRLRPARLTTQPAVSGPPERMLPTPTLPARRACDQDIPLPIDHADLLAAATVAVLSTRLPTGYPQTQPVWFGRDGCDLLVTTTLERRKGRNLLADPRATLLVIDRRDGTRWIEVRADADLELDGAEDGLDELTRRYTRHQHYYGGISPPARRETETRVVVRLHPRAVHCDAVHR